MVDRNSDIWRRLPRFIIPLFRALYLTCEQGSRTSIAASLGEFSDVSIGRVAYLQPYWIPSSCCDRKTGIPFPAFELLGAFQDFALSSPRLPEGENTSKAAVALWEAYDEFAAP